ncbi:MAG: pirin [Proteobacteria bacterium]|nr:pirin [Pseudomonadota bacterium]
MAEKPIKATEIDYRKGNTPEWVHRAIEEQFAIESEDARRSGNLGYMTRALVLATMPYKDPKVDAFTRTNGDFKLRILAGYEGGIPFGIYPRLLMSWVSTEAVRSQSPVIELGDSMRAFLKDVLELRTNSGGSRGVSTRVAEQMKRTFGSLITAQFNGKSAENKGGFVLRNIVIADALTLEDEHSFDLDAPASEGESALWTPQKASDAGQWKSKVRLSDPFFKELLDHPVPIDLRAYKALRGSPLAMDIYTWLTYRMSYTNRPTRPILWESLMMQFGSSYSTSDLGQATRDFKKAFLNALKAVQIVYPAARLEVRDNGLVLLPSPPHIPPIAGGKGGQASLF